MLRTLRKPKSRTTVGPKDHGRRMSLARFDTAIGREGYLYELHKGVITVADIPHPQHLLQVSAVRDQLSLYRVSEKGPIQFVTSGGENKILVEDEQSERHPDISVYLTSWPDVKDIWSVWVPEIVVEVVSETSAKCDYEDKPAEYLSFGISEYWIIDGGKGVMTALVRWRGKWQEKTYKANQKYPTQLLPGFVLDLKRALSAEK